jgi:hypothetical protein
MRSCLAAATFVLAVPSLLIAQTAGSGLVASVATTTHAKNGQRVWSYVVTFSGLQDEMDVEVVLDVVLPQTVDFVPGTGTATATAIGTNVQRRLRQRLTTQAAEMRFEVIALDPLLSVSEIPFGIELVSGGRVPVDTTFPIVGPGGGRQTVSLAECAGFIVPRRYEPSADRVTADAQRFHDCASALKGHVQQLYAIPPALQAPAAEFIGASLADEAGRRRYFINLHTLYRQVKLHNGMLTTLLKKSDDTTVSDEIKTRALEQVDDTDFLMSQLSDLIHNLMATVGIRERLAASFDGGVSFAEAGDDAVSSGRDDTLETTTRGLIRWETEHFGDDAPSSFDVSVAGAFGFAPILTMVSVDDGSGVIMTPSDPPQIQNHVAYLQGIVWEIAPRLNWHVDDRTEFALSGRFGHTWLTKDTDTFERRVDQDTTTTVTLRRLRNGSGRVAPYWEAGVELRLHAMESLDLLHHEKSYLNPAAYVGVGFRRDSRFQAGEQLVDTDGDRLYFRLALSINRIVGLPAESKISSIQFGVEYDRSISRNVPGGFRLFIGPDINVVKLLRADAPAVGTGSGVQGSPALSR